MPLPRISRVEFFLSQEGDLIHALARAIVAHAEQYPDAALDAHHLAIVAWSSLRTNVPNGGFTQFFYNHRGDDGVKPLAKLLDSLEVPKVGTLLRDAVAVYRRNRARFEVANPFDGLFGSIKAFDKLDKAFMNVELRATRALANWIRSHIAELAIGDDGEPINTAFTGVVEIMHPNGILAKYLEVKKGKPHGAYRTYFEDGTLRKGAFFKSGKRSGDFWPDGQLKKKESKSGSLKIYEWFYPGGQLQKRMVKNKDGENTEPIRLFHANGQLAEEMHFVKDKKRGPWRKYFDDGTPKLEAEYGPNEKLIVHNAWADDRRQIVKNGTGTFREDSHSIDWEYELQLELGWPTEFELRDGKKHGKATRYSYGRLWSIAHYVDDVQQGEETSYWDNGRVRSVTKYVNGKAGRRKDFPKFDDPVPAVVITIEADQKLYEAWDHLPVDEYPQLQNLAAIQAQVQLPEFLLEVDKRNREGTLKDDYEDWNTFDDGIAYFLTVNEAGTVAAAHANGSGVYSGGEWDTYLPLLRQLRFTPGRIRGRAVECRVLACVDHKFVERNAAR
jgi:antitoxin component YwqK of YwqJK toxin-antitoxin module